MKYRNGFVSNSSSSSFLVMLNGSPKEAEIVLRAYLELPPGHPFESMVKEVVDCFVDEMKTGSMWDRSEYYDLDEEIDMPDHQLAEEKKKEGWSVYNVSFSNEGEPIEAMLCYMTWNLESANLIIKGEGGF